MTENAEAPQDDIQLIIDNFFEKVSLYIKKESVLVRSKHLRSIKVDYPQIEAKVLDGVYQQLIQESFNIENIEFYLEKWLKYLIND